ncbi:hypothetical protein [Stutzerimonas tarimensis]|uniref:Uncharacterized protein n=1 Tax=Stutzerimonas tarimensis TaxID=1507735 RepID=A0ABV7T3J8_9GAMM
MNALQMLLCALVTIGTVGAGVYLDLRVAERDRAARVTDYSDPDTLMPNKLLRKEAQANKGGSGKV